MSENINVPDEQGSNQRSVARNAVYQIGGRFSVSAGRLIVAILIIRYTGAERFGEYSLILSLLLIGEWLVDFGISEIGVRSISQQRDRQDLLLRAATIITSVQAIVASVVMLAALHLMDFPPHIIRAATIGLLGLFVYAGIIVYRILFRVRMSIEKNVVAEVLGLITMIPLVIWACLEDATVDVFIGTYLVSRIVHFCIVMFLGRGSLRLRLTGEERAVVREMVLQAAPLGVAGLLNSVHANMIPVMLSKMVGMGAVGEYSYTVRFAMLVVMVIQSLNIAFFPLLSAYWVSDKEKFAQTQQNALEVSVLIGAGLFVLMNASAEFIVDLAGAQMADAVLVLRLMSWLVLLRVITMPISPLIVVAGGQMKTLWIAALSLVFQFLALLLLVPDYAAVGAVVAALLVKLTIGTVPIIVISGRLTGLPLKWTTAVKTIACAVTALLICDFVLGLGPLWVGILSFGLYGVLTAVSGALSKDRIQFLYAAVDRRRGSPGE